VKFRARVLLENTMTVYNDEDRIERIIATLSRLKVEDLMVIQHGIDRAMGDAKRRARMRAEEIVKKAG
jgi:hypothetical protein